MPLPKSAPLPDDLDVSGAYTIRWAAVDPVTGADVSGVVISNASAEVDLLSADTGSGFIPGPFMLVPGPEN